MSLGSGGEGLMPETADTKQSFDLLTDFATCVRGCNFLEVAVSTKRHSHHPAMTKAIIERTHYCNDHLALQ